jgi:hypothetical protein
LSRGFQRRVVKMRACLRVAISEFGVATTSVQLGHQLPCPIDPCNRSPSDQRSRAPDRAGSCSIFPLDIDTHTHTHTHTTAYPNPDNAQPHHRSNSQLLKKRVPGVVSSTSSPASEPTMSWHNSCHRDLTPAPCEAVGLSCSSHKEVLPLLLQKWREGVDRPHGPIAAIET